MTIIVNLYPCILASSPFVNSSSLDLPSSSAALCICNTIITIIIFVTITIIFIITVLITLETWSSRNLLSAAWWLLPTYKRSSFTLFKQSSSSLLVYCSSSLSKNTCEFLPLVLKSSDSSWLNLSISLSISIPIWSILCSFMGRDD